jgi:hypothetical protein
VDRNWRVYSSRAAMAEPEKAGSEKA